MNYSTQELNKLLAETSPHNTWRSFDGKGLDQCIKWANSIADLHNPKTCFRKLSNSHIDNFRSEYHSQIGLKDARSEDLDEVYNTIYGPLLPPNLKGGRMLVMRPNDTLSDGMAELITNGFFDTDNFPPPMLTATLVDCPEFHKSDFGIFLRQDSYILSYIPKLFVPMVDEAICANAEESILWLEDEKHFTAQIFIAKGLGIDESVIAGLIPN